MRLPIRWKSLAAMGALLLGHEPLRAQGTLADYQRGQALGGRSQGLVVDVPGAANWIGETDHFWYTRSVRGGTEFVLVDAGAATKKAAFDHEKLAAAISSASGKPYTALTLPFSPRPAGRAGGGGGGDEEGGFRSRKAGRRHLLGQRQTVHRADSAVCAPDRGTRRRRGAGRGRRSAHHQPADFYRWGAH